MVDNGVGGRRSATIGPIEPVLASNARTKIGQALVHDDFDLDVRTIDGMARPTK
jgi:hypothetical protein